MIVKYSWMTNTKPRSCANHVLCWRLICSIGVNDSKDERGKKSKRKRKKKIHSIKPKFCKNIGHHMWCPHRQDSNPHAIREAPRIMITTKWFFLLQIQPVKSNTSYVLFQIRLFPFFDGRWPGTIMSHMPLLPSLMVQAPTNASAQ